MNPTDLAFTCKEALFVFSQNHALELQADNDRLRLENFHLKLPGLLDVMTVFNYKTGPCLCLQCAVGARADADDAAYHEWIRTHQNSLDCQFRPKWEQYLVDVGATINPETEFPETLSVYGFDHGDTPAAVYTISRQDWVFAGWGRPLKSLNSPRKRIWDRMLEDYNA